MAILEARPYRPFKSSEEYLEAMKEDLAEWLNTLYPELLINAENFMARLDTGVALCKHANCVRQAAEEYLARRQARYKSMTRSITSGLAGPILAMGNVHYLLSAKSGTFFARDNVSNFITWCRKSLKIIECLLFETDDLIMRKNEKHVILCLLEVARRGAKFGVLAPMLVQMERQIDREIAADNKANGIGCGTQTDNSGTTGTQTDVGVGTDSVATETDIFDSEEDDEDDGGPMLMYGPQPQIITNDLKSLDEMVRDLVEMCTCPSQFPMIRVSEGKYRIGDTKVLIFVRILRSHVMVRVGGGWDTLSHYLDKHDPCRCRAQHRSSVSARFIPRTNNQSNGIELHKAQVVYERSPPSARKIISTFNSQAQGSPVSVSASASASASASNSPTINLSPSFSGGHKPSSNGGSGGSGVGQQNSRSPTPQRKYLNQCNASVNGVGTVADAGTNVAPTNGVSSVGLTSPGLTRRSMSPSPRRLTDMRKKQNSLDSGNGSGGSGCNSSGPKSLPLVSEFVGNHVQFDGVIATQTDGSGPASTDPSASNNKFENISDNGSEISDEGYRSLGVIHSNAQKRESVHSQASIEDADNNVRLDPTSSDSQLSPVDEPNASPMKSSDLLDPQYEPLIGGCSIDGGMHSLPAVLQALPSPSDDCPGADKFQQSGIYITDDSITVDIADTTGLRKTGFSTKILNGDQTKESRISKIPRSPGAQRRRSVDNSTCGTSGSLQDLSSRTGLPVFNRQKPVYRSVRKTTEVSKKVDAGTPVRKSPAPIVRDVTNTWSGRTPATGKKRPTVNADTFLPNGESASPPTSVSPSSFERSSKTRSSQIIYDSNGRRVRSGCTSSLTTSPVKHQSSSPLAQQLLEAASTAKNDAQILAKMKTLLSRYASSNQSATNLKTVNQKNKHHQQQQPQPLFEDFTSAWVHSNGNLERSNSCSPPTKSLSKRSLAASSTDSTTSQTTPTVVVVSPRRDRGLSKIPAPIRHHTELY